MFNSKLQVLVVLLMSWCQLAVAQIQVPSYPEQLFELTAPELGVNSQARLSSTRLEVTDSRGAMTVYSRSPRYDSNDGQWVAFASQAADQIIRWPATNSGRMQIGSVQGASIVFRSSRMTIRSVGGVAGQGQVMQRPVLPPTTTPQSGVAEALAGLAVSKLFDVMTSSSNNRGVSPQAQMLRMVSVGGSGAPYLLSRGSGFDLRAIASGSQGADWWVSPVGNGYVRFQSYQGGRIYSLSAVQSGGLSMLPASQDPRQLWRVSSGRLRNRFVVESVAYAGACLEHLGGGQLGLRPVTYVPNQLWVPFTAPTVVGFQPFWRSVSTEVVANSQLPPAELDLVNNHRNALIVGLGDSRRGGEFEEIRIEPGTSKTIQLERDSGATIVETVEIRSASGVWDRQQFVTAIPPRAFYDLSVYEEHLQSIAIDATGKSPNPIEDVNYVPKSIGWLPLPSGNELPARGRLDVYERAKAAGNPGAVRRLDPSRFDEQPQSDPLEKILQKFESTPRRRF